MGSRQPSGLAIVALVRYGPGVHIDRRLVREGRTSKARTPSPLPVPTQADLTNRVRELEDEVADLRSELERSERRVDAMKQIGRALGSNLALDPLLFEIVARTTQILEADRSTLFLLDRDTDELVSKVLEGQELREIRLPIGVGLAGWVAARGEPLHIKNAYDDPRFNPEYDKKSGYKTRCMLVWPVRRPRGDQIIGVIQVLNKRNGNFDPTDERLLEAIASEIGVGLEVSRLYGEAIERNAALERARAELMLLIETERAISQAQAIGPMLEAILATACANMSARGAILYLLDDRGNDLVVSATSGLSPARLKGYVPTTNDPLLSEAMLGGQPILCNETPSIRRGKVAVRRALATPIITKNAGTIGVLELLNRHGRTPFSHSDALALAIVASQAGRAIAAERERSEKDRAERLTTIGRMLSGVVHDLRTPMTLISGYTELMSASDDPDERERYARSVVKQIDMMSAMTRDLLAFARGERSVLIRKVYVERFMAEMQDYLRREFEGTGVALEVKIGTKGAARFDETKLLRVFHNIARNAREAMPGGGKFTVTVAKKGTDLVFSFSDTGGGVSKDIEGRMFQPFVTGGKAGGTGLGLAMVKRIAEEHRGTIAYESVPGKGTSFFLAIPAS